MTLSDEFKAKAQSLKLWQPSNPPTNRDRLELYALHKQSVDGDCTAEAPTDPSKSVEKQKWSAWKSKEGLTQSEAMARYITECDRQIRVYGSLAGPTTSTVSTTSSSVTATEALSSGEQQPRCSLRGVASLPFLVSAASEPRSKYLSRMSVMTASSRFWDKQASLATSSSAGGGGGGGGAVVGGSALRTAASLPARAANMLECGVLCLGRLVEKGALSKGTGLAPTTLHAMSYPLHVLTLTLWIGLIFVISLLSVSVSVGMTLAFGSRETKQDLPNLFDEGLRPTSLAASSLSAKSNPLPLRCLAFLLLPLPLMSSVVDRVRSSFGDVVGSFSLLALVGATGWYWAVALPCVAVWAGGWTGAAATVAAGLIEAAGLGDEH